MSISRLSAAIQKTISDARSVVEWPIELGMVTQIFDLATLDSKSNEELVCLSKGNSIARYFFTVNCLLRKGTLGEKVGVF